jgi:hypothetical protein
MSMKGFKSGAGAHRFKKKELLTITFAQNIEI